MCDKKNLLVLSFSLFLLCFTNISRADALGVKFPAELQDKLTKVMQAKGADYKPRTEHLSSDGKAIYTNRLILDSSPYLVQHAHNPVNWYSWGPEAFAQAKKQNKLIFLSIGYSTCHWCHVMEKESFENLLVAKFLNEHFIAVKVDREQRPDVDATFMAAVMLLQGSGGWPMTVFLTPQGQPFYGGTYYPLQHLMNLLNRVNELWQNQSGQVIKTAEQVTAALKKQSNTKQAVGQLNKGIIQRAVSQIMGRYDELQGGFSQAPKFPNEAYLFLLLDNLARNDSPEIYAAMQETLNAMAAGGIYDQVGGGFHRYATDNSWLIPHFEKMLYNQAHLGRVYSQFYSISNNAEYARISRQIFDYVLRDMTSPEGGFYSASDADSEGEEGTFFLWQLDELESVLEKKQLQLAKDLFGVTQAGNFEHKNILFMHDSLKTYAQQNQIAYDQLLIDVDQLRQKLYQVREQRIHPFTDKKVLTAWNGMMITALVQASQYLQEPKYLSAAIRAAKYLQSHNYDEQNNRLWRSSLDTQAAVLASQEDYAYYAQALIQLFDTTGDSDWLLQAENITSTMLDLFWDQTDGAFYMDNPSQEMALIVRPKDLYDGAIPSGNSIAMEVLAALFKRTGKAQYEQKAEQLIAALSAKIQKAPNAFAYLLTAFNQFNQGELGRVQYGARGKLRAKLVKEKNAEQVYLLHVNIDDKWHINSHYPNQEDLIPTDIVLGTGKNGKSNLVIQSVQYPQAIEKNLSFNKTVLSLYEQGVSFKINLKQRTSKLENIPKVIPLDFSYQACSDKVCLSPETLRFYLYL